MTSVCVYCASSTQIDDKYFRAAEELGHLIAEHGLTLITGAGKLGLMNTIENAALEAGGKVTGVIPSFMVPHPPGRAMMPSDRLAIVCLRSCIEGVSINSVNPS